MKKVLALLVAMILCVSLFASCGEKISTPDDKELNNTVVLKAEDVKVGMRVNTKDLDNI